MFGFQRLFINNIAKIQLSKIKTKLHVWSDYLEIWDLINLFQRSHYVSKRFPYKGFTVYQSFYFFTNVVSLGFEFMGSLCQEIKITTDTMFQIICARRV